jgi:glycosyltransferase involved in cell wall biosynthesis
MTRQASVKILQVMFSRGQGGLERVFQDHAELLAQRGHAVHCLVADNAACTPQLRELVARSQGRIVLHVVAARGWSRWLLHWRLRRLVSAIAPQAIVAHGAKSVSRMQGLQSGSVPLIAVTHNASARLAKATHLIALTQGMRELFVARDFPPARIYEIPNPLPLRVAGLPKPSGSVPQPPLRIGLLCRLVHKKGVDLFLRGFRIALDGGLQAQAVIGGDGPERERLEALTRTLGLEARVRFDGWVREADAFYRSIDWFCIPSRDEPFGLVALESFAHGVPVLASSVGGLEEIVTDGVNGLLFRADDPAALATTLLQAQQQSDRVPMLCEAAYASLERYRPEAIAARIETSIQAAIADLRTEPARR